MLAFVECADVRLRHAFLRREFPVANQAVWPEVDDVNLKVVATSPYGLRDVNLPRRTPDHAEIVAVEPDLCQAVDDAEGEEEI